MGKRILYLIGILVTGVVLWLYLTPNTMVRAVIKRIENVGYDLQLHSRVFLNPHPKLSPIVIVDVDDISLKIEGHWPWPRDTMAVLVDKINNQGPLGISMDLFFPEKQPNIAEILINKLSNTSYLNTQCSTDISRSEPLFDQDAVFAKSIAQSRVLLSLAFIGTSETENTLPPPLIVFTPDENKQLNIRTAAGYIANIPSLQAAAKGSGFINVEPDEDGIARRASMVMRYKDAIYPALSLETVISLFGDTAKLITPKYDKKIQLEGIQLGNLFIPTDWQGQVLIPFVGPGHTFPYFSATDVLHDKIPGDAFFGKIVIIGSSATGLGDIHVTPIDKLYTGVEVQATLLNGILSQNFSFIPAWSYGANFSFIILFGLVGTFLFPQLGPRLLGLGIVIFPLATLALNSWLWNHTRFIFSSVLPIILVIILAFINILYGYLFETRKREQLKKIFGQYVPDKHIDEMVNSKDAITLHGETREMTVLFADIRNFTAISEHMDAADLVKILNAFFTPMTEIIFKNRGTIDKYIGDLLMAFWGAPLKDKNHVVHALNSALEMNAKVNSLMAEQLEKQLPEFHVGIGINTGLMSVGDMGSRYRRNYTVLGDAVNLASRLETLTKYYGANIIVGENTHAHQTKFIFRTLDKVKVKGRETSSFIYELICHKADLTEKVKSELEIFHQALEYYFQQKWNDAYTLIAELQTLHPHKTLYHLYLARISEYKLNPPLADWDGVYVHHTK